MTSRFLPYCAAAGITLTGCAANGPPPAASGGPNGVVRTYTYYDANHPGEIGGQPSEQAIYNINHSTWLWPPATSNDRMR
jgi:hypothetical protein